MDDAFRFFSLSFSFLFASAQNERDYLAISLSLKPSKDYVTSGAKTMDGRKEVYWRMARSYSFATDRTYSTQIFFLQK